MKFWIGRTTRSVVIAGLAAGLLFSGMPSSVGAQSTEKSAIAISPPLFELSANPGTSLKNQIRIDNLTDMTLPITVERKDFVALGEEGQAELTTKASAYSLSSWITLDSNKFSLAPRASRTVNFKIAIPQKAEPGGHFGSIVFKTTAPASSSNGVGVGQEIGGLLLLKVAGKVRESGTIESFKSMKDIWESGPVQFETRFHNTGNVQMKPSGTITVTNMFGQKIDSTSMDSRTILPDSIRKITAAWKGDAWPGWYTATVSVGYGSDGKLLTDSTTFLLFPYKVIIPVLIVLILLGALIFKARRRLWRSIRILLGKE